MARDSACAEKSHDRGTPLRDSILARTGTCHVNCDRRHAKTQIQTSSQSRISDHVFRVILRISRGHCYRESHFHLDL
ncbi:unnamed protein product [Lasius platythorax]|uniref:Uncharacterized protein n=1 Tax=Lasius platythorax TaxID=488582 RepID=A0AAV2P4K3_9HYME